MALRGPAPSVARARARDSVTAFLRISAILSLACLFFLWKPIATGEFYAAGDVSGLSSIVRAEGTEPARLPQIDVVVDILPWIEFSGDELRSGHLPTWNPYNNSGVPHLANIQAAVFSPFSVPFYLLSMRMALIVSIYLLLMTAGLLAYGLMRHLGASELAGIVTALAYMFSGYLVFWLRWPLASVAAFLPGILWASSALIRAVGWRQIVRRGCAVMVLVALAVFAGHPETLFFGLFPSVAWCVASLLTRRTGVADFLRRISMLAAAGVAGLALAAVQVLPFTEYLLQSPTFDGRQVHVFQSFRWSAIHAFPLAHGSPTMAYAGPYDFLNEFHEITILYVGIFVLVLGAVAVLSPLWTKQRTPLLFAGLAVAVFVFVYDVFGAGTLASRLPVLSLMMPSRVAVVWALCLALLAGFGVDALRVVPTVGESRRRTIVVAVAAVTAVVVAGLTYRAWRLYEYASYRSSHERQVAWQTLVHHVGFVVVSLLVGLGCAVLLVTFRGRTVRRIASVGIVLVVFLQGGLLLRGQNSTVPADRFMNFSPRVSKIARHIGVNQTIWVDQARLMPDVNLWIPAYSPDNYDVIGIDAYQRLFRATLNPPHAIEIAGVELGLLTGPYDPPDVRALQAMGIRRVVTKHSFPLITSTNLAARAATVKADGAGQYTYRWRAEAPRELIVYTAGVADGGTIDVVVSGDGMAGEIRRRIEIHGSLGAATLPAGLPDAGVMAATFDRPRGARNGPDEGRIVGSSIVASPLGGLELDASVDGYQIFEVPGPSGFLYSPSAARFVTTDEAALDTVLDADFDPTDEVVIEQPHAPRSPTSAHHGPGRVRVTAMSPTQVTATVTRTDPGYVVFTQNHYPGWRATVNGEDVPVRRANSSYQAVRVPSGTSTVRFHFESTSLSIGIAVSIGTLLVGLVALLATSFGRRDRQ
jgi:hypothetical protein